MAFSLTAVLGLNRRPFQDGLRSVQGEAQRFGRSAESMMGLLFRGPAGLLGAGAGALGIGGIFAQASQMIDDLKNKANEIRTGALSMGVKPEEYQRIKQAAEYFGIPIQKLDNFIDRIELAKASLTAKPLEEWKAAEIETAKAMELLGLSFRKVKDMGGSEMFWEMVRALRAIGPAAVDSTDAIKKAIQKVGGRGVLDLLPMLSGQWPEHIGRILSGQDIGRIQRESFGRKRAMQPWEDVKTSVAEELSTGWAGLLGWIRMVRGDKELKAIETELLKFQDDYSLSDFGRAIIDAQVTKDWKAAQAAMQSKPPTGKLEIESDWETDIERDKVAKLEPKLAEAERKAELAAMTAEERRAALQKELDDFRAGLATRGVMKESELLEARMQELQLESELAKVKDDKLKAERRPDVFDSLARIGITTPGGGAADVPKNISKMVEQLTRIDRNIATFTQ